VKVLVTGAGGQLGSAVLERFHRSDHEVDGALRSELDIGDRLDTRRVVTAIGPDVIVNCAAFTKVDACEDDVDTAMRINALGVRHVVEAAEAVNARVVHVSTDYVFDGRLDRAYDEWDMPNPTSAYGRSKLGGELELREEDTIVRTSWVFGRTGHNIVKTVLRLAAAPGELTFVDDQRGKPTYADDLADRIYGLVVAEIPGRFHVTNSGETTWFQFTRDILELIGDDPGRVRPVKSADVADRFKAPRPANSVLDNMACRLLGLPELRHHKEALAEALKALTG
jgi:dTDP-4-dehydrorhamnose reductase